MLNLTANEAVVLAAIVRRVPSVPWRLYEKIERAAERAEQR